jgi:hypothetical protein
LLEFRHLITVRGPIERGREESLTKVAITKKVASLGADTPRALAEPIIVGLR